MMAYTGYENVDGMTEKQYARVLAGTLATNVWTWANMTEMERAILKAHTKTVIKVFQKKLWKFQKAER